MAVVVDCIACDSIRPHRTNPVRLTLSGVMGHVRSRLVPPFPVQCSEFSLFVLLAEVDSEIEFMYRVVSDTTGAMLIQSRTYRHPVAGGPDQLLGLRFRVQNCTFPAAGLYWVECWNHGVRLYRQRLYAVA